MTTYYIHFTDGTKEARHWCDMCDEQEASHRATYWTDAHTPKWSTVNGEQYTGMYCFDCVGVLEGKEETGKVWGVRIAKM